jgi:hypothetical protein
MPGRDSVLTREVAIGWARAWPSRGRGNRAGGRGFQKITVQI